MMEVKIILVLIFVSVLASQLVSADPYKDNGSCNCKKYTCGCCQRIKIKEVNLNANVCANVAYIPSDLGVGVSVSIDGRTIINETVSAKNPPALCAAVPFLKKLAKACIKFKNLNISKQKFSGCVYFTVKLALVKIGDFRIGCFDIPLSDLTVEHDLQFGRDSNLVQEMSISERILLLKRLRLIGDDFDIEQYK